MHSGRRPTQEGKAPRLSAIAAIELWHRILRYHAGSYSCVSLRRLHRSEPSTFSVPRGFCSSKLAAPIQVSAKGRQVWVLHQCPILPNFELHFALVFESRLYQPNLVFVKQNAL